AVAGRLNKMQIPTARELRGHKWKWKQPEALWWPRSVATIVQNPVYAGTYVFRRRDKKGGAVHEYPVPALVSPELWQRTQQVIAENLKFSRRNTKHRDYQLRGLVRCGVCGLGMSGMTARSKKSGKEQLYFLYRCHGKKLEMSWAHGLCPSRFVPAEWLEQLVWEELAGWIADGASLETALQES